MNVDMAFQITAEGVEDGGYCRKEPSFLAERYECFYACRKDGIEQNTFFKEECPKLGWHRESDVIVRAIWEQPVHVCYPSIDLDFGANRTETAFAGSGNMAYFFGMVGTDIGGVTKAFWLPAIHDFPNIVGYMNGNQMFVDREEGLPVILKNLLESKAVLVNDFHNGREFTPLDGGFHQLSPQGDALCLKG